MSEKEQFNPTKYKNDFQKEKYDRIIVNVDKGKKECISNMIKTKGYKSMNKYITTLISQDLNITVLEEKK